MSKVLDKIISVRNPKSPISESYRGIRTSIEFSNLDNFNGLEVSSILGELGILFPRLDVNAEIEKLQSFVK